MKLTQQLSMTEREKTKATELWNIEGPKLACGHLLVYLRGDLGAQEASPRFILYDVLLCGKCVERLQRLGRIPKEKILTQQQRKVAQAEIWLRNFLAQQGGAAPLSAFTRGEKLPFGIVTLRTALRNLGGTEDNGGPRRRKSWRLPNGSKGT